MVVVQRSQRCRLRVMEEEEWKTRSTTRPGLAVLLKGVIWGMGGAWGVVVGVGSGYRPRGRCPVSPGSGSRMVIRRRGSGWVGTWARHAR